MPFTQELPGKLRLPQISGRDRLKYLGLKGETAEKKNLTEMEILQLFVSLSMDLQGPQKSYTELQTPSTCHSAGKHALRNNCPQ